MVSNELLTDYSDLRQAVRNARVLKEQKAYFDAQQRKSNQQWEQMHKGLQEEVRVLQAEVAKERPRTDKLFSRQNEFAMATQNVSKELGLAKEAIAAFDVPKDLNQKLQNLDSLDQLRSDIKACDKRSASTETGLTSLTATVTSLTHSVDTLDRTSKARDNMAQTLTEAQNKLRETISKVDNKVNAMAEETTSPPGSPTVEPAVRKPAACTTSSGAVSGTRSTSTSAPAPRAPSATASAICSTSRYATSSASCISRHTS